jgi:hypothetical protein
MQNTLPQEGIIRTSIQYEGNAEGNTSKTSWTTVLIGTNAIGLCSDLNDSYLRLKSKKVYSINKFDISYPGDPSIEEAVKLIPDKLKDKPQNLVISFTRNDIGQWVTYVFKKL